MKKTIPESLAQRQEKMRQKTSDTVVQAILSLEAQGYDIKIKDLMCMTGLSRSVFSKSHIRKVMVEHGIIQPQSSEKTISGTEKDPCTDLLLEEKDRYIQRLLKENEQLRYEVELLRGKVHILMHKVSALGEEKI